MEQNRVKKYKEYRDSLGKKEDPILKPKEKEKPSSEELIDSRISSAPKTTTSIPYEQIMKEANCSQNEENLIRELKKKRIFNIILFCIGITLLTAIIVVSGILIFRQGR